MSNEDGRNARYPKCFQTCNISCILFGWHLPIHFRHGFPDTFATVAVRFAMPGRALEEMARNLMALYCR